jgi:hypothetical protein
LGFILTNLIESVQTFILFFGKKISDFFAQLVSILLISPSFRSWVINFCTEIVKFKFILFYLLIIKTAGATLIIIKNVMFTKEVFLNNNWALKLQFISASFFFSFQLFTVLWGFFWKVVHFIFSYNNNKKCSSGIGI